MNDLKQRHIISKGVYDAGRNSGGDSEAGAALLFFVFIVLFYHFVNGTH